jgi:hypothetical protein
MKSLLILKRSELPHPLAPFAYLECPMQEIANADMVIVKTPTHFRCLKHRYIYDGAPDEKIPNRFLKQYLMEHADKFTTENLIDSLL